MAGLSRWENRDMYHYVTPVSRNTKTGPIPVSTSSRTTCPTSCPLIQGGGCYADYGPLRLLWDRVTQGTLGSSFDEFLQQVRALPKRQLWRYGQAGDLPGDGDLIDRDKLLQLAIANRGRPVIAFTHKPATVYNVNALREAKAQGFMVNLSANNPKHADELAEHGLPVVVILPSKFGRKVSKGKWAETLTEYRNRIRGLTLTTPKGRRIGVCPATYLDTTCRDCGACSHERKVVVIGFPAHGTGKRKVEMLDTS